MVDGVKIAVPAPAQGLLRRMDKIQWTLNGRDRFGSDRYHGEWRGWHFTGDLNRCWRIRGSFHKHAHDGSNWRDLTFHDSEHAILDFCDRLLLHPGQLNLENVEIGVGFKPPKEPEVLLRSLVHHKLVKPSQTGLGLEFIHNGYIIKIYNKAEQYGLPTPLIRFEVKAIRMREVSKLGIRTVSDLLDPTVWHGFEAFLLRNFKEILVAETPEQPAPMSVADRELIENARHFRFWRDLPRYTRTRKRDQLYALYKAIPGCDLRERIHNAIQRKARELCPRKKALSNATFTPRVITNRLGRNPALIATFTPLIARGAGVAAIPQVWWGPRGPPRCSNPATWYNSGSTIVALKYGQQDLMIRHTKCGARYPGHYRIIDNYGLSITNWRPLSLRYRSSFIWTGGVAQIRSYSIMSLCALLETEQTHIAKTSPLSNGIMAMGLKCACGCLVRTWVLIRFFISSSDLAQAHKRISEEVNNLIIGK